MSVLFESSVFCPASGLRRRGLPALVFLLACGVSQLAFAAAPLSANAPHAPTDQPVWRQSHGVLLSVTRAGDRLVAAGDRGTILLSDDQGGTWRAVASGTDELLTAGVFVSPTEGWLVGQDSTVLHSTDAGLHWASQLAAPGTDQALFSVAALAPGHLVATGSYALMLETTDGSAWSPVKLPNLDEDYHLNCVMAHGADLVITGEAGHAFLRHGTTWTPIPVPYDGSQFGCLTTHDGTMFSFGLRGSLFAAGPGPGTLTWKRIDTGEQRSIFGGALLANGFIALVGSNGLMMLFDPQTDTLRTLPPVTAATLSAVAETQSGKWVVVGEDGVHTVDPAATPAARAEVTQ